MVSPSRLHNASDPETFSRCIIPWLCMSVASSAIHTQRLFDQPNVLLAYGFMTNLLHPTNNKQAHAYTLIPTVYRALLKSAILGSDHQIRITKKTTSKLSRPH